MKSNLFFLPLLTAACLSSSAFAADANMGIVSFASCISDSKLGKQEQTSFEGLKKQMSSLLEDTEKQLQELATKSQDQEYLDGLSPEGELEMKAKFEALNQDLQRYQNQYYQVMNQANMQVIQKLNVAIGEASKKVAKEKSLGVVVNKDACFFYAPNLDVTNDVISEMDKIFVSQDSPAKVPETLSVKKG